MFKNLRIGARLALGFAAALLALVVMWVVSELDIRQSTTLLQQAADRHEQTAALSRAQSAVWSLRWDIAQFIAVTAAAERKQIVDRSIPTRNEFEDALRMYGQARSGERGKDEEALAAEVGAAFKKYSDARLHWFELVNAGKTEEAAAFRSSVLKVAGGQTVDALGKLIVLQAKLVDTAEAAGRAQLARSRLVLTGVGTVALVLAALVLTLLARSITRPLGAAIASVETVAEGDLTRSIHVASRDEVGQLLAALRTMQDKLKALVGEVMDGARTVADTSAQIAQGNVDLSQRTEEQASTLEETASSMEELTATVNQNAENARQASQLAADASEVATRGGRIVDEVVSTMAGISEASRKIADIIGVIDGIAFQTNILALNAAVEAARAGEQGRGFAVVAAEVRNLAQRSAEAAKEIKALIGDSAGKVEAGSTLVNGAGSTMQEIVSSARKVSDLVADIAAASREQSSGIAQVTSAVGQMDQVVQQNASLVEEATAATESMKAQAASLLQIVTRFNIGTVALAEAATPPAASTAAGARPVPAPIAYVPAVGRLPSAAARARTTSAAGGPAPGREWRQF